MTFVQIEIIENLISLSCHYKYTTHLLNKIGTQTRVVGFFQKKLFRAGRCKKKRLLISTGKDKLRFFVTVLQIWLSES